MPTKSRYVRCLEELGFKPLAEVIGAEAAVEMIQRWKEAGEDFSRGLNREQRRRWNKAGKTPRFSNLGGMTIATDDTEKTWAIEKVVDLKPRGFVDLIAYFAAKALTSSHSNSRLH